MIDELVVRTKIPEGAQEVLVRVPYEPHHGDNGFLLRFEPSDVTIDYRTEGGVWTPAELCGGQTQRYLQ